MKRAMSLEWLAQLSELSVFATRLTVEEHNDSGNVEIRNHSLSRPAFSNAEYANYITKLWFRARDAFSHHTVLRLVFTKRTEFIR